MKHGRISQRLRDDMLRNWEHTGFSVDGSVRILKGDRGRLRRLVRYMARPAVSVERISYDDKTGRVTVRSAKKLNGQRPVVATYDALTFLALLALQVPPPGVHLTRYYAHYSTVSRARRRSRHEEPDAPDAERMAPTEVPEVPDQISSLLTFKNAVGDGPT